MKLLTPKNVAEILSVSPSTVIRMCVDQVLPSIVVRRGRKKSTFRIREETLQRWINAKEKERTKMTPPPNGANHHDFEETRQKFVGGENL